MTDHITLQELVDQLVGGLDTNPGNTYLKYPSDAIVYAYEGESTCLVIMDKDHNQLDMIDCPYPRKD